MLEKNGNTVNFNTTKRCVLFTELEDKENRIKQAALSSAVAGAKRTSVTLTSHSGTVVR